VRPRPSSCFPNARTRYRHFYERLYFPGIYIYFSAFLTLFSFPITEGSVCPVLSNGNMEHTHSYKHAHTSTRAEGDLDAERGGLLLSAGHQAYKKENIINTRAFVNVLRYWALCEGPLYFFSSSSPPHQRFKGGDHFHRP